MDDDSILAWLGNLERNEKSLSKNSLDFLRPQNLNEYVGQPKAKQIVATTVQAALKEQRALPNILISGPFGQGKTILALLMAQEYGKKFPLIDAASVNKNIVESGTVIIDEIHNLDATVCDSLNILLDSHNLHIIGCTTNPGALPSAFRSRFRNIPLGPYSNDDISQILTMALSRKGISSTKTLVYEIAKRSRLNPRISLNNLSFILDVALVKDASLGIHIIDEAFHQLGIDKDGFSLRDYAYLDAIPEGRSVGIQYISAVTSIDPKTIEEEIEPYLMQKGLIDRTSRGRHKL